ncbi:pyrimidodiazepine synthase-like [Periplaneta americana]|uniref:pyrimidodiazepine synthase-like n=1 Tax=Periplaneta americana TaxID=6978 RepID=UPI0037E745B4
MRRAWSSVLNSRHLARGSTNPPLVQGKLRLYSMRFCPYAHRVHLVLDAKHIPYDVVNVHLKDKPEWFLERNPLGKVPAVELESGDCLYESLVIADYLDEKYPQRPLYPKDLVHKAKERMFVEHFGQVARNLLKLQRSPDNEHLEAVQTGLDVFERELASRRRPFFGGEVAGMLDYMIWPWCERIDAFELLAGHQLLLPRNRYSLLNEWKLRMMDDDAVKISFIDPKYHAEFIASFVTGSPNYDILAEDQNCNKSKL